MAVFGFWRRRLCFAKTKTPPPFGSGVQEIRVIGLEPDCRAAQQQRSEEQQWVFPGPIHGDTGSRFRSRRQSVFCFSPANTWA
jgi:hypothetical protein